MNTFSLTRLKSLWVSIGILAAFLFFLPTAVAHAVSFDSGTNVGAAERPFIIETGDFNEDGDLDLVATRDFTGDADVIFGNGNGTFGSATFIDSEGEGTRAIAVADLDEDNNLDIVLANSDNSTVKVVFGDGTGAFSSGPLLSTAANPRGIAIADMNNDNDLDLVVSSITGNVIEIFPGDGIGGFGTSTSAVVGSRAERVAVGDFNGDSNLDAVVTGPTLKLMLGDGAGNLGSPSVITSVEYFDLAIADFNGDNDLDIVAGQTDMDVILGDGAGGFGTPTTLSSGSISEVAVSDLDNDGDADVIGTDFNGTVLTFLNDGSASFTADATLTAALGVLPVVAGDFDNSGFDDLVVGQILDPDDQRMIIYLNQSVATFAINIDVGAYTGLYNITGQTGGLSGNQTVNLNPGNYSLLVGQVSAGAIPITVTATGTVISGNTDAAVGAGDTLTFNTASVNIDVATYTGQWQIFAAFGIKTGNDTLVVVPALSYSMSVGISGQGNFLFDVDASGNVTSQNTDAATGSGNTLTFNTTVINIDPDNFTGQWQIFTVTPLQTTAISVTVVPGLGYLMNIAPSGLGTFVIDVDGAGDITSQNTEAATAVGNTLTFNNESIDFTPTTADTWSILAVQSPGSVPATVILVPGLSYSVQDNLGNNSPLAVNSAPCDVDPDQIVLPGVTLDIACTQTGPTTVNADKDAILRKGARNRNEGANPLLHLGEQRRQLVGFDLTGIDTSSVTNAELILTINDENDPGQWGSSGRLVGAHNVTEAWVEGDGKGYGLPGSQSTRGSGDGVTWKCAIDTAIENQKADCSPVWDGGNFAATATDEVLHTNGMTGEVVFDVTSDVTSGGDSWIIKKANEGQNGNARYYSKENDEVISNPDLAPRLVLTF